MPFLFFGRRFFKKSAIGTSSHAIAPKVGIGYQRIWFKDMFRILPLLIFGCANVCVCAFVGLYTVRALRSRREPSMKYCLSVKLAVNPAKRDAFLAAIRDNAKGTLTTEAACRQYTWGESTTTPCTFHFQEQFDDKAGFDAHTMAPHFKIWEQFASQPDAFTAPPVLDFFEEL